jgi:hypothetical protein
MSYLKKIQLKTRFLISLLVFSLLFSVIHIAYGVSANEYTVGKIEWPYKCHPLIFNTATIRVIDPDMNLDVKLQDTLDIQIWSDFDLREEYSGKIMTLTLQETGNSTGIFDGIIFWGNPWDDSLGRRIPIWDGNTVTARYTDHTIPSNFSESKLEITNSIAIKDIKPVMKTENGTTTAWVIYEPCTLEIFEQKNVSLAEKTEFVFPPPLKQIKSGILIDEIKCKEGLELVIKKEHRYHPMCVKPETKIKLIERGWTKENTLNPQRFIDKNCPASFMEKDMQDSSSIRSEPELPLTEWGQSFTSYDKAQKYSEITINLPSYVPDCLKIYSIVAKQAYPYTTAVLNVVYLLDGVKPNEYYTLSDAKKEGLVIQIQKDKNFVYQYPNDYVEQRAKENKHLGWDFTMIEHYPVQIKNRNTERNMPSEIDTIINQNGILIESEILEIDELEKIFRSMFEELK